MSFPHMSGPDHFLEAQRLLAVAADRVEDTLALAETNRRAPETGLRVAEIYIGAAHVHATLAQAAAGILPLIGEYEIEADDLARHWAVATGYRPREGFPAESPAEVGRLDRLMDMQDDDARDQAAERGE
jgi:hypothetical protein